MRSNRLLIGVACGVALALGVLAAVVAGTQTAGAATDLVDSVTPSRARDDRRGHPFRVSITQHWIDQRIASTALRRRLWASLEGSSGDVIHQSGPKSGSNSFEVTHTTGSGKYVVDFKRDVSACSWTATPFLVGNLANNPPLPPSTAVTARANGQPTGEVTVYVFQGSAPKDSHVAVQVLC
jgi:hypothetical protein